MPKNVVAPCYVDSNTERGNTMIAVGQLLSSLNLNVIASAVEGETTVPWSLLLEDEEFVKVVKYANTLEEVVEWVNENY